MRARRKERQHELPRAQAPELTQGAAAQPSARPSTATPAAPAAAADIPADATGMNQLQGTVQSSREP